MARGRELGLLPSVIAAEDGTETEWNRLSEKEKESRRAHICRKTGERLSAYYWVHPEEWERFAGKIREENR